MISAKLLLFIRKNGLDADLTRIIFQIFAVTAYLWQRKRNPIERDYFIN